MTEKQCSSCRYDPISTDEYPCICCKGYTKWDQKMEEKKEPDYKFSQEIIDALRDGKTVWLEWNNNWIEIDRSYNTYAFNIKTIVNGNWSLTKPKVMVKKRIERWANIDSEDEGDFEHYPTKEYAEKDVLRYKTNHFKAIAVPFTIEWEQEE